jgi:hypothetical protein
MADTSSCRGAIVDTRVGGITALRALLQQSVSVVPRLFLGGIPLIGSYLSDRAGRFTMRPVETEGHVVAHAFELVANALAATGCILGRRNINWGKAAFAFYACKVRHLLIPR